jgi:hypothetical protein
LQGLSHKGYVSKPLTPEARKANRLRDEAVKKKKDAAKEAAAMKRDRKEKHAKACKIAQAEGAPRPPTPESTEEEDSSSGGLNFSESDDFEVETGASPKRTPRGVGGEGSSMVLGEARLALGTLVEPPCNTPVLILSLIKCLVANQG